MDRRLTLHQELVDLVGHAYFQPPPSVKMIYPCVVYNLSDIETSYADNDIYQGMKGYTITIIDRNPDSNYVDQMLYAFRYCRFDRFYTVDNLNHFVFRLYF